MDPVPPTSPMSIPPVALLPEPKNKIWVWIVAGILLLGVGIIAGVLLGKQLYSQPILQPTPLPPEASAKEGDPTADWETYTSNKYGFSFKHPGLDSSCCNVSGPIIGKPEKIVVLVEPQTTAIGTDKPFNGLGVFVDSTEIDLTRQGGFSSYLYGQKNSLTENYREFMGQEPTSSESPITIGGITGIKLTGFAWWGEIIYVPLLNRQKILTIVKTESSKGSFDNTFDQILSTFKFLDTSITPTPATVKNINYSPPQGWIIHPSPIGFSFSYPPSYKSPTYDTGDRHVKVGTNLKSCTIDLRENNSNNFIQFILMPYSGGSRRQFLMDVLSLFPGDLRSTQEARLDNLPGLLASFKTPYGTPPILINDETAIFIKKSNLALIVFSSTEAPNPILWNGLLSSLSIDQDITLDLDKCK